MNTVSCSFRAGVREARKKYQIIRGGMRIPVLRPVRANRLSACGRRIVKQFDCVLFPTRPSSRYRSPPAAVGIAPPVSPRPVIPPRLPYRWAGSCEGTGRGTGRGTRSRSNQLGAVKQSIGFSAIADKLSIVPLSRQMRGRHIFHTVPASVQAPIPFL